MRVLARKALLIYIDDFNEKEEKVNGDFTIAKCDSLDTFAKIGCNGFLVNSARDVSVPTDRVRALLGVKSDNSLSYPDLKIAFYSYHKEARELRTDLKFIQIPHDNLLQSLDQELTESSGTSSLVFIHLCSLQMDTLSAILTKYGLDGHNETSHDIFVAVVQRDRIVSKNDLEPTPPHPFRPKQSYDKLDGTYIDETNSCYERHLVTFYQKDRVRRDRMSYYALSEFHRANGYGTMHSRALLKEIAFRLAKAPKYGA